MGTAPFHARGLPWTHPVAGDEGPTLLDRIGVLSGCPHEACVTSAAIAALRDALRRLTDQELSVLNLRYGLTGDADHNGARLAARLKCADD
jgi:DNA-directed RNA polymerase sigma subunit (sigma70/sigma32)